MRSSIRDCLYVRCSNATDSKLDEEVRSKITAARRDFPEALNGSPAFSCCGLGDRCQRRGPSRGSRLSHGAKQRDMNALPDTIVPVMRQPLPNPPLLCLTRTHRRCPLAPTPATAERAARATSVRVCTPWFTTSVDANCGSDRTWWLLPAAGVRGFQLVRTHQELWL